MSREIQRRRRPPQPDENRPSGGGDALLSGRPIVWHVHNMIADGKTLAVMRLFSRMPAVRRLICVCQAARQ